MAQSKAYTNTFIVIFASLSALGLFYMRIQSSFYAVPKDFDKILESGHLNAPFRDVAIPQHYTGFQPLDAVLALLVAAFSHGPLHLVEPAYWQQLHFLIGFFPCLAVYTVEAYRERHRGSILSWTSVWALFYQTIAGAAIIPLHNLCYVRAGKHGSRLRSGRLVPPQTAQVLVPGLVLGFLVPTVLLFVPWFSRNTTLYLIAYWQFTPIFVNIFISLFSTLFGSAKSTPRKAGRPGDLGSLDAVYLVSFLAALISHLGAIAAILSSATPDDVTLKSVFVPDLTEALKSTGHGLNHLFQWDEVFIGLSSLCLAFYAVTEVRSQQRSAGLKTTGGGILASLPVLGLISGPGGALAAVWWWREHALVDLEEALMRKR